MCNLDADGHLPAAHPHPFIRTFTVQSVKVTQGQDRFSALVFSRTKVREGEVKVADAEQQRKRFRKNLVERAFRKYNVRLRIASKHPNPLIPLSRERALKNDDISVRTDRSLRRCLLLVTRRNVVVGAGRAHLFLLETLHPNTDGL